ncbi:MATE family efflux transporter [Blautia sp. CLA-JM-H16]|uniref:Probable multidrug resistance protein NorM n=1 Tax=Blautia aquisgranensis TaxID=3133153 RepID=A0ABV1BDW2_9FIRM
MKKTRTIDLTSGPIFQTLAELALPIMASSLLGTAYNITDMAWIGLLGSKTVAGVGVGGMYVWLSQGLVALPRMGGQVNTAQACGRKDYDEARSYAASALQITILFGVIFAAVCLLFLDPLIGFFNLTDPEAYEAAKVYMLITCGLIIFSFLNLTLTGLFTAQGDSRSPLMANFLGLVGNMILDPLLILGVGPFPRLETVGAAVATVTAQILVFAVLAFRIFTSRLEPNVLRGVRLFSRHSGKFYKNIFRIGFPTSIQSMIYCMISMVLTRMVSAFGAAAIATQRVGGQIESVSWNTADGFAAALNAFTAQNYGARKYDRIRHGYRISFGILAVWGLIITAAFVFLPKPIAGLFFHDAESLSIAVNYLIIIGFSEGFMAIELMTIGALSGLGLTKLCSIISILLTGARIPLALVLSHTEMGLSGIWWALSLTSIVKGIVFTLTFRHTSHTRLK